MSLRSSYVLTTSRVTHEPTARFFTTESTEHTEKGDCQAPCHLSVLSQALTTKDTEPCSHGPTEQRSIPRNPQALSAVPLLIRHNRTIRVISVFPRDRMLTESHGLRNRLHGPHPPAAISSRRSASRSWIRRRSTCRQPAASSLRRVRLRVSGTVPMRAASWALVP